MSDDHSVKPDDARADSAKHPTNEDRMPGRSFAGAEIAATERDQTRERERVAEQARLDEIGEPTDDALDPQGDLSPRRRDPER